MAVDRMLAENESALVVTVPEAEPLVGGLRAVHDPSAAVGVPAHVTVVYPFAPPAAIDAALEARLRELFAGMDAFDYRFERVARFGDATVFLAPEPAAAFSALTRAVVERWPQYPPYAGAHDTVIPHLTVGDQLAAGAADGIAAEVEAALARVGPVRGQAGAVDLIVEEGVRWSRVASFALRGA
jgi:hypothetical protein